jgi:hypothetical protein
MWCDQRLGQLSGGAEGGDRVGVTPARHFEAPASVVEMHSDGRSRPSRITRIARCRLTQPGGTMK